MTLHDGLVVVVPRGFDRERIPGILERKQAWIERACARAEAGRGRSPAQATAELPQELDLLCLNTVWKVQYVPRRASTAASARTTVRERPGRQLLVHGDEEDTTACRAALRRWLVRKARSTLVPRLAVLAYEHGFAVGSVSVRTQRTRWASCSRRGAVSLNVKLLFLPPGLVDYVLLHELCHTVRPDHSAVFWALLSEHDPEYRSKRWRMREARRYVPEWFEERGS